ncbi:MAG: 2'-5' RNA ligase [Bacteroidetes bacterium 4484_249]|nr:MAG: 2'-5' RNA ligase [Bacteroidetes bacterium 4484_249]
MKRVFAAIKLHPSEIFMQVYNSIKIACKYDKIKWVEPLNIHITLKFFGETEEDKIEDINSVLSDISFHHSPFILKLSDVGIFGSSYKPRVIWFGIDENKKLQNLATEIIGGVEKTGFLKDRQNFVPHLTIGRIKFIDNKRKFQDVINRYKSVEIQQENIDKFFLIESILKPAGPEYKILKTFTLK